MQRVSSRDRLTGPVLAAATTFGVLAGSASADQLVVTWEGGVSSSWNVALNWNPVGIPTNGANTYAVIIPGAGGPTIDASVWIDRMGLAPGASVLIPGSRSLRITADDGDTSTGFISNEGMVILDGGAALYADGGQLLLGNANQNPGVIHLSAHSANIISGWTGAAAERLFNEGPSRIEGAGSIGGNLLELINYGEMAGIHPDVPLTLDPRDSVVTVNHGLWAAQNGGTLRFAAGIYENGTTLGGGGVIEAADGSVVEFAGGSTLQFSTLTGFGSGVFRTIGNTVTFRDVTLVGTMEIPNSMQPRFQDTLSIQGDLDLLSTGNAAAIYVDNVDTSGLTITGPGTINLGANTQNYIFAWNGGETLDLQIPLVRGSGFIGNNSISVITSEHMIAADQPAAPLVVDAGSTLVNHGTLRAANGATLHLAAQFVDNTAGIVESRGNSLVELGSPHIDGGTLLSVNGIGPVEPGRFRVTSNTTTFEDVVLDGFLDVPNAINPRFIDTFVNLGEVNLQSSGNGTLFYIDNADTGGVVLSGGGTINLSNNIENYMAPWNGGELFDNVDNLIRGSGRIGNNGLELINRGEIRADQPAPLNIDPATTMLNEGLLRAEAGGTLELFGGTYDSTLGAIEAVDATLTLSNAVVDITGSSIVLVNSTGNLVSGFGILGGDIIGDADSQFLASGAVGLLNDITFNSTLTMLNGAGVRYADAVVNTGDIHLASSGNGTLLYVDNINTTGVQLSGGGTIHLGNHLENYITAYNGGETFENVDNTIRGSGRLGNNSIAITNHGTIIADQPVRLEVDPDAVMIHDGVMRAESGGTLRLQAGTYECAGGGTIENDASLVEFIGGAALRHATITSPNAALFTLLGADASVLDCTFDATMDIPNGLYLRLRDGFENTGTINLDAAPNSTLLYIDNENTGGVLLTGDGVINLSDHLENYITAWNGGETFENVGNTIRGSGRLGNNSLVILNSGTIIADQTVRLEIDPNGPNNFSNAGTIHVLPGSTIRSIDNIIQTGGQTIIEGTLEMTNDLFDLGAGILTGIGIVAGDVVNEAGVLRPAIGVGPFDLDGDYTQQPEGILEIDLAGEIPFSEHDVLTVDGLASLGGTLKITYVDGFVPKIHDTFTILDADDIIGEFDEVIGPGAYSVIYRAHTVTLVVEQAIVIACLGDISGDGTVGPVDLAALLAAWGPNPGSPADFNGDDAVGPADLAILLAAWGACP
ncbi:MAG: hypothetical protein KDA25_09675 [Phycisphaerales bacterium]|nr:hypothetical protein [Phycisphaerales bacterium]